MGSMFLKVKTDTLFFFFPLQGHLFKQIVLTIYVCGNIVFLIAFLAAVYQIWNKQLKTLQWSTVHLKNLWGILCFPQHIPEDVIEE